MKKENIPFVRYLEKGVNLMFERFKKTAEKADETMDQVKKDLSETSEKMQEVLDSSGKSVQNVVKIISVALVVSIITNIITIGINIAGHKKTKAPSIIIQNLYLGGKE